jgi:tetratricopeptide (TPR) repeat protein
MKNIILLFAFILACASACTNNHGADSKDGKAKFTSQEALTIPVLLDRNEAIRNGKEWDNVQNIYGSTKKALLQNPNDWDARLKLAELFIQEARVTGEHPHYYPAALFILEPAVQQLSTIANPNAKEKDFLFRALSYKASVQLSLHDFANALETGNKAVAINPYNAQIYGALVDAHVELGQYKQAVEMADKMVGIRPDLRSYSRISYLREIYGDVPGAIEALDMAIKAGYPGQESTAWARLTLGNLYKTYGEWDKAEMQYHLILQERTDYPFAVAGLGAVAMHKKDYPTAIAQYQKACSIIPEVSFYEQLAQLYATTKNKAALDTLLPKIVSMMQEDMQKGHNVSLELAAFYTDLMPELPKALQYAQEEYARRPDNIDVNRRMAAIYEAMGDKQKAKEHYVKAAATGSKHPDLLRIKKEIG